MAIDNPLVINQFGPANSAVIMGFQTPRSVELFPTIFLSHSITEAGWQMSDVGTFLIYNC